MDSDPDLLSWLPRTDEVRKIPGGVIFCESWEAVRTPDGRVTGEIRFRFAVDAATYQKTVEEVPGIEMRQKALPGPTQEETQRIESKTEEE